MRRKLLLSHLATAVVVTAVVRVVIGWVVEPQFQALPGGNPQIRQILDDLGIVLLASSLLIAGATYFVFEWMIRRRLSSFRQQLHGVADATDASARVMAIAGDAEIASLAQPVNHLLGTLQTTREELLVSERRLALALEATGDGLWDYHRGASVYFSESYYKILGYQPDTVIVQPEHWMDLIHPEDKPAVQQATARLHKRETDLLSAEMRMQTAAGEWKWVHLRGRVLARMPDGQTAHMIGTLQDIDGRRQSEQAYRENQELFRNAFEESAVGMALVRADGTLLRVNSTFCDITGYSEAELLQLTFQDITHPDDLEEDLANVRTILNGERRHYTMEKRYLAKGGRVVWISLSVGVVLDSHQQPLYLIGQVIDITLRKQHEAEQQAYARHLLAIKEELERSTAELAKKTREAEAATLAAELATRTKSAFLANISHEIRTPMAAIIGFADLLLDQRLPEVERARCIETIGRQGQHLLSLINDLLDLSKIEAGKMAVESIECDPTQVVADVEAIMSARAMDKGIPLTVAIGSNVPKRVRSDPTRLRQVLLNLVSNAVKFTNAGKIQVQLTSPVVDGRTALEFVVIDSGIGMSQAEQRQLFEPFSQADVSTTRRFGGTGLGLAISKRLVEMMGGRISVQSAVGQGSCFTATLPVPVCEATPTAAKQQGPTLRRGLRVLLADDGEDNRRLISFYLQHAGIDFELAENGRVAVDRAVKAKAARRPFDLVLMDMQMPEMDGCEAAVALRRAGLAMPILALTAHATEEAKAQSLSVGCAEHLIKPVDPTGLLSAIAHHTARPVSQAAGITSSLADHPQFKTVLDAYILELPAQVSELIKLSGPQQDVRLRRLLHQIKGTGGGYGLNLLSDAAARAEAACDEHDVNLLAENVDDLIRLMRLVQGYDLSRESGSCSSAF